MAYKSSVSAILNVKHQTEVNELVLMSTSSCCKNQFFREKRESKKHEDVTDNENV